MVQIISDANYSVKPGNIFGRIGAGVGKGLAEQLPKEIERNRLASGLNSLRDNPGASPLDQLIQLYTTPGVTPEMATQIQPHLQAAAAKAQREKNRGNAPATARARPPQTPIPQRAQPEVPYQPEQQPVAFQPGQPTGQSNQPAPTPGRVPPVSGYDQFSQNNEGITTAMPIAVGKQPIVHRTIQAATPDQIWQRADQINNENPNVLPEQAYAQAEREDATRITNETAAENARVKNLQEQIAVRDRETKLESDVETLLSKKVENATQKKADISAGGLFESVPGEYYNKYLQEAKLKVATGRVTPEAATEEAAKKINSLDKAITSMRSKIGARPFWGPNPKQLEKDLLSYRSKFAENDALELYKNELVNNLDQGDHTASTKAFPPSKPMENAIISFSAKDSPKKIAASIRDKISDSDSIFTIGNLLNKIGVNDVAVVNELNQMKLDGLLKLNERQEREASEYYPTTYSLGDILYETLWYPDFGVFLKPEKVNVIEKLKRYLGKR